MHQGIAIDAWKDECCSAKDEPKRYFGHFRVLKDHPANAKHHKTGPHHRSDVDQRGAPQVAKGHPVQGGEAGGGVPAGTDPIAGIEAGKNGQVIVKVDGANCCAI